MMGDGGPGGEPPGSRPAAGGRPGFVARLVDAVIGPVDRWQRGNRPAGFVVGVVKKFGDDRGGTLAALVTFYGFLSIFPLLLVATTVLGFDRSLQHSVQRSALSQFPVVGPDLVVGHLKGNTFGLVVGVLGLLWGSLGVAQAVQYATQQAWTVPDDQRPGFVARVARSAAFVGVLGAGVVGTSLLTSLGAIAGHSRAVGALGLVAALVLNAAVFLAVFKIVSPADLAWRDLLPGAAVAAAGWQVLQTVGQTLVRHNLKNTSALYGQFAVVLGLISFLSLAAQMVMYSVEVNVVRHRRLWPRSIMGG